MTTSDLSNTGVGILSRYIIAAVGQTGQYKTNCGELDPKIKSFAIYTACSAVYYNLLCIVECLSAILRR